MGYTALMEAASKGHTEAIKALLTAPDINVNYAKVSMFLLTLPHLVVGGGYDTHLLYLVSRSYTRGDDLSSPDV